MTTFCFQLLSRQLVLWDEDILPERSGNLKLHKTHRLPAPAWPGSVRLEGAVTRPQGSVVLISIKCLTLTPGIDTSSQLWGRGDYRILIINKKVILIIIIYWAEHDWCDGCLVLPPLRPDFIISRNFWNISNFNIKGRWALLDNIFRKGVMTW